MDNWGYETCAVALEELAPDWSGRHVAFVHITKTSGTSLTTALNEAMGVTPLILTTDGVGATARENVNRFGFWPLITGHLFVGRFPNSHQRITLFREPRARILSCFRHDERHRKAVGSEPIDLTRFLNERVALLAAFFFTGPQMAPVLSSEIGVPKGLTAEFSRHLGLLSGAAWCHDSDAVANLVQSVSGRQVVIPRMNVAPSHHSEPARAPRELLDSAAFLDSHLMEVAVSLGLLPEMSWAESNAVLMETADHLSIELL